MTEKTVAMEAVLAWLGRVRPEEGRRLLAGCALDDGESEDALPIAGLEWGPGAAPLALLLEGGGRKLFPQVAGGVVVDARPGAPLVAAIEAARTPGELAELAERRELVRAGVNPDSLGSTEDRRAVLALHRSLAAGRVPPAEVRRAAYLALRAGGRAETGRWGARLFREVFALCRNAGSAVPDDCHWRLAALLRQAGELREAIAVSDVLHAGMVRDPQARKLLATTRVGALLEQWRATRGVELARQADRALKVAWAIGRDDAEVLGLRPALNRALEQTGVRG
ncbi:MAG TPA: hypothetical protein VK741_30930 [Acetobacteraceae bacterium]|nr:hypothetical protein [Acetobacteraceae bacterium]